jgi:putative flippase GtrA
MTVRSTPVSDRLPPLLARLIDEHGSKALRYLGVSAFNVVFGTALLGVFHGVFGWDPVPSNVTAWAIGSGPAYYLNRQWVWQQSGSHSLHREVLPFWIIALVGLLLSTAAVGFAGRYTDETAYILLANLSAYGVIWVAKYVILDKVMWRATHPQSHHLDPAEVG